MQKSLRNLRATIREKERALRAQTYGPTDIPVDNDDAIVGSNDCLLRLLDGDCKPVQFWTVPSQDADTAPSETRAPHQHTC
jgi:hypothetical protein